MGWWLVRFQKHQKQILNKEELYGSIKHLLHKKIMTGWLVKSLRFLTVITVTGITGGSIGYLTNKAEIPTIENIANHEETKNTTPKREWKSSEVSSNCKRLYYSEGLKWWDDKKCENRLKKVISKTRKTTE